MVTLVAHYSHGSRYDGSRAITCDVLQEGKPAAHESAKKVKIYMANTENGTFLTVAEVADLMRVSKMTVYRLIHSEELPAVQVGRNFRVRGSAVDAYLGASEYNPGQTG